MPELCANAFKPTTALLAGTGIPSRSATMHRYWPTRYLLDQGGYLRYGHFGEGGYGECEQVIQELLREIDPDLNLPAFMEPVREADQAGAICYRASGELYLGHRRGRIGNQGG